MWRKGGKLLFWILISVIHEDVNEMSISLSSGVEDNKIAKTAVTTYLKWQCLSSGFDTNHFANPDFCTVHLIGGLSLRESSVAETILMLLIMICHKQPNHR